MLTRLTLLAALAAVAFGREKIVISQTSFTIDKDSNATVNLRLVEPIICPPDHEGSCTVAVQFTNPDTNRFSVSPCVVEWTQEEWNQVKLVRIWALENFVDEPGLSETFKTEPAVSNSVFYKGFNAKDVTVTTRARPSGHCSGTGDPHYTTFDGKYWHVYAAGTYVFYANRNYANPRQDFEVQVAALGYPAVHCGFAAKEGNDIFYVSACSGRITYQLICGSKECQKGPYPMVGTNGGRAGTYSVTFKSGRRVWATVSGRSANMYATAPGRDYQSNTVGICGNFNGNSGDDAPVYMASNLNQLKPEQRPSRDLFNWRPSSIWDYEEGPSVETCAYTPTEFVRPLLSSPDVEDVTDLLKNVRVVSDDDVEFNLDLDDFVSANETMDETTARQLCQAAFDASPAATACDNLLGSLLNVPVFVDGCVEDLSLTADETFIDDAIDQMSARCASLAESNTSTWETDNQGNRVPNTEVADALCPNSCSGNGACNNAKCVCDSGFSGRDCSVDKSSAPVITSLSATTCNIKAAASCASDISVFGSNFWNAENLTCRYKVIASPAVASDSVLMVGESASRSAFFLGSSEVICQLPDRAVFVPAGLQGDLVTIEISVSTTDSIVSEASLPFTFYDGVCSACANATTCAPNPDSCSIDGVCVLEGTHEASNVCRVCVPEQSTTSWSYDYTHAADCGPDFKQDSYSTTLSGSYEAGDTIFTFDADNANLQDDPNYNLEFTMTAGNRTTFAVTTDGRVVANIAFDVNELPYEFHNLVGVQAVLNGQHPTPCTVVFDIVSSNRAPILNETYTFNVTEDTPVGTVVGTIMAYDPDEAGSLQYEWYSQVAGEAGVLLIDESTGVITVGKALDYERVSSYLLLVSVRDGGLQHMASVHVFVGDVNEAPTDVAISNNVVAENQPVGTVVANLTAQDQDAGDSHTFSVGGTDAAYFQVVGATLQTAQELDYEALHAAGKNPLAITITATDAGGLTLTKAFDITVQDVNEAPYNIQLSQTEFLENLTNAALATVTVQDQDAGQTVTCTIVQESTPTFELLDMKLYALPGQQLDHETNPSIELTIGCADDGTPMKYATATFTITVLDAFDMPGHFTIEQPETIYENATIGTVVGTVVAVDQDHDSTDFELSVVSDYVEAAGPTSCTKADAAAPTICRLDIRLTSLLDYEGTEVAGRQALSVIATLVYKGETVQSEGTVYLEFEDLNELPTGVSWRTGGTVEENLALGGVIGTISAQDPDQGQTHTFSLASHQDRFTLSNDASGMYATIRLSQTAASPLNYDSEPSIELSIVVLDSGNPPRSITTSITITVENQPVTVMFQGTNGPSNSLTVSESTSVGTVVGKFVLQGNDNQAATYSVRFADNRRRAADAFSIQGLNLVLSSPLDAEEVQTQSLNVVAVETIGSEVNYYAAQQLTINIQNEDEAPVFGSSSYTATVDTTTVSAGDLVVLSPALVASDPEGGDVTFSMASSSSQVMQTYFQVSTTIRGTFELSVIQNLAMANIASGDYNLDVQAEDATGHSSTQRVVVTLTDGTTDPSGAQSTAASNKMGSGAVAGIVIGLLVLLVLIAFLVLVVLRKRQNDNVFVDSEKGKGSHYDNPSFGTTYATPGSLPVGFVPGVSNPLYEWYQPEMTRQDCSSELATAAPGTFLVRDSKATPGWHILGVKTENDVLHEKIRATDDGMYQLLPSSGPAHEQPRFGDLPSLINHYGSRQSGMHYALNVNSVSNPMYAMSAQSDGLYGGVALPNDRYAPAVPLKEAHVAQVEQLAATDDIYSNTRDAQNALSHA
ncbi:uncharacterized protein MONBRDRAFT_38365 [Monosiga brevicollis MX1]|uniref:Uncharacterized protein n=1 Tax=Monosiga brevicollis TaxID=81824 RepID=A9V792_MONBE|nr:uncharacterized protein MONBRDRAFT_38365 [Monosiga brevicollis MX1]EDQ86473.1 predicted protein [Monosiga brevicollis MX1]|eukprot:XP_001748586.1 hypothetical protein [Monosiga brevicollis MX1]